jgi:hypothetical protein
MMGQTAEYTIQDSYVLKGQGGGGNKKKNIFEYIDIHTMCTVSYNKYEQTPFCQCWALLR